MTQDIKMDFYPIFCPQKLKIVLCVHVKVESDLQTIKYNPKHIKYTLIFHYSGEAQKAVDTFWAQDPDEISRLV